MQNLTKSAKPPLLPACKQDHEKTSLLTNFLIGKRQANEKRCQHLNFRSKNHFSLKQHECFCKTAVAY